MISSQAEDQLCRGQQQEISQRTSEREYCIIQISCAGNIFSHFITRPNFAKMSDMPSGVIAGFIRWTNTILSLIDEAADCKSHRC